MFRKTVHPRVNVCALLDHNLHGSTRTMARARMNRPFRKIISCFGSSRQCLIMRDMETLWGISFEALPGQCLPKRCIAGQATRFAARVLNLALSCTSSCTRSSAAGHNRLASADTLLLCGRLSCFMCIATLRISLQAESCLFKLEMPRSWCGRIIPAIWHGTGANPGVFIPKT